MPVTIHTAPALDLTPAEIDRWRAVPVAVAVDLGRAIGQIDPAIRPLRPAGRQPRLFGRAVTAFASRPISVRSCMRSNWPGRATCWSSPRPGMPRPR